MDSVAQLEALVQQSHQLQRELEDKDRQLRRMESAALVADQTQGLSDLQVLPPSYRLFHMGSFAVTLMVVRRLCRQAQLHLHVEDDAEFQPPQEDDEEEEVVFNI